MTEKAVASATHRHFTSNGHCSWGLKLIRRRRIYCRHSSEPGHNMQGYIAHMRGSGSESHRSPFTRAMARGDLPLFMQFRRGYEWRGTAAAMLLTGWLVERRAEDPMGDKGARVSCTAAPVLNLQQNAGTWQGCAYLCGRFPCCWRGSLGHVHPYPAITAGPCWWNARPTSDTGFQAVHQPTATAPGQCGMHNG